MSELGPVEVLFIAFPGNQFHGDIVPAIKAKVDDGTINVIDALFVAKADNGDVVGFEIEELPEGVRDDYGSLVSEGGGVDLLGLEDVEDLAEEIEPGNAVAILVVEHVWAKDLAAAMRGANGELIDSMRIPAQAIDEILAL